MTCTICRHPRLLQIDRAILGGRDSLRSIAHKFQVSYEAVKRHQRHIQRALVCAEKAEAKYGDTLLTQIESIQQDLARLQAGAEAGGDRRAALTAIREKLRAMEITAKLTGQIQTGSRSVSVTINQQADEAMEVREYLEVIGCPPELVNAVLEYVGKPRPALEGVIQ